jgi:hypothetical protein
LNGVWVGDANAHIFIIVTEAKLPQGG